MGKVIRPTYPFGFSMGLLLLIFVISCFMSPQIFSESFHTFEQGKRLYLGMFLVSFAVIVMVLIIWEEFLFPIKAKVVPGGLVFRNHRTKLVAQLFIYFTIPAIFVYIYQNYEVNTIRYFIWAAICVLAPILEKIVTGLNNYNDFLKLTRTDIEYKNNEKEGLFHLDDIQTITIEKEGRHSIKKINLLFKTSEQITIDLDEMELEAYYESIYQFITVRYKHLLK